ncbi:alpha/beta fold hydrolase [Pseudonocardia spinosispora]|uniref:alpha/beta fold hydrolase n=1 Tax=Pseudonocardia spinosispora TaxID=103441 RepID=UPI000491EBC0|nr:alpha/beta fold hydrolase [Pseudonocardia spinosispora]
MEQQSATRVRTTVARPSISYAMDGPSSAPAIVLLHSLATRGAVWRPVMAELSGSFRMLVPDTRGHGDSAPAPEMGVDDWVSDIDRVLDDAGVDRAALVGVSMGGIQALAYAAARPDRVSALVVADSFAALPPAVALARISAMVAHAESAPMTEVAAKYLIDTFEDPTSPGASAVASAMGEMKRDSYLGAVRACFGADVTDRLAEVVAPTLVLWGDRDHKTPKPLSEAIRDGVRDGRLEVVPDAGHLSNVENPEAFARAVRTFLTGL